MILQQKEFLIGLGMLTDPLRSRIPVAVTRDRTASYVNGVSYATLARQRTPRESCIERH